jgi:hypothetical protein
MMPKALKKNSRILVIVSAVVLFFVVGAIVLFLYVSKNSKPPEDNLPPIIKQVIQLNEDIKKTTMELYNASGKLDSISMVQSRITDIKSTIELIGQLRDMVGKNQNEIDDLLEFIGDHEVFFQRKNLAWIFPVRDFYSNENVAGHNQSRDNYLAAFETLLQYTYDNFENIMEHKSQQHMKNYDVYYLRYRRAAELYNRSNRKRIAFQKQFVEEHPEVSPFIPGSHHFEPFKFWDKFSF